MLLVINLLFLLVGMFLDPLAALIILVPIFLPIANEIGVDPVHFGIIVVVNLMIGLCTPPVGYLISMTASTADVSPTRVVRESVPFVAALMLVLLLITYPPDLTLAEPRLVGFLRDICFATPLPPPSPWGRGRRLRKQPSWLMPQLGRTNTLRSSSTTSRTWQPSRWSLTRPIACMNA